MRNHNFVIINLLILILCLWINFLQEKPFALVNTQAFVQENPEVPQMQWNRTYRGSNDDYCYSLIQTTDGGFALAGVTNYLSETVSGSSMWLIKTNSEGIVEWDRTFGGNHSDFAYSLIQTTDKGFALVGLSSTFGGIWLIKTDTNGIMEWNQTLWKDYAYASTLLETSDRGYAIFGSKMRNTSLGYSRVGMFLIKTDVNGVEQWNQSYGGNDDDYGNSFILTDDGGYALAGGTYSYGNGSSAVWLVKIDSLGRVEWNQSYGGMGYDRAYDVIQIRNGEFVLVGETTSYGSGERDMYVVKTDANGNLQWNKTYGGTEREEGWSLIQTNDNGFALAGVTTSYGAGEADMWLVKIDSSGNLEWNKTFGGNHWDYANTVIQTTDGGIALAGRITTYGDADFILIKMYGSSTTDKFTSGFTLIPLFFAVLSLILLLKKMKK